MIVYGFINVYIIYIISSSTHDTVLYNSYCIIFKYYIFYIIYFYLDNRLFVFK